MQRDRVTDRAGGVNGTSLPPAEHGSRRLLAERKGLHVKQLSIDWTAVAMVAIAVLGGLPAVLFAPPDQSAVRDAGLALLGLAAGLLTRVGAIGRGGQP